MKTVIVTGGSRGIGRAVVELLAQKGFAVAFTYSNRDDLAQELCEKLTAQGKVVCGYKVDNADLTALDDFVRKVIAQFGNVYGLVNNCAYSVIAPLCDMTTEQIERTLDVNLKGAIYLTKQLYLHMASNFEGRIVNISSVWGQCGASCESVYSASKGGLISFTKAIAKELAPSNILANCICPGVIDTDMNSHLSQQDKQELCEQIPLSRFGTPQEVASAVLFMIESSYITGQILTVDGGFTV